MDIRPLFERHRSRARATTLLVVLLSFTLTASADARTIKVTRTDDPASNSCQRSGCTLREAVSLANRLNGRDQIVLRSDRTYRLSPETGRGLLDLGGDLAISASGRERARIEGARVSNIFKSRSRRATYRFAHLDLDGAARSVVDVWGDVRLIDSVVRNGGGSGVESDGLDLKQSTLRDNRGLGAYAYQGGSIVDSRISGNGYGGIYICRQLRMRRSIVSENRSGYMIAAIQIGDYDSSSPGCEYSRPFKIRNSRIVDNLAEDDDFSPDGGGIAASGYAAGGVISGSVIARNSGRRGGIEADSIDLIDSRVVGNVSDPEEGAGGVTGSNVRVSGSTIARNEGRIGGMFLYASKVEGSTITGNVAAQNGGGIDVGLNTTIVNSTIVGNRAAKSGGGIFANEGLALRSSTVASNIADSDGSGGEGGGGVFGRPDRGGFFMTNSVVAENTVGLDATREDCAGSFNGSRNNLLTTADSGECEGFGHPSNLIRANPGLRALGDYGGRTATVALEPDSPAISHARKKGLPPRDQRGVKRDRRPDIGAFERR